MNEPTTFEHKNSNRFVKMSLRTAILLFTAFIVCMGMLAFMMMQGVRWLYGQYAALATELTPARYVSISPIEKIKDFLGGKPITQSIVNEPIRVVSEESQIVDVVRRSSGAVVSIIASGDVPILEECGENVEEYRGFFDFPDLCQRGTTTRRIGAGSGFVASPDGYIVTNKHVVQDAKATYTVVLNDERRAGQKVPARVVARDPNNDIAILKIDSENLPYLEFSDSANLQVGQTVIAIGYALGEFDNTVSKGVVSGLLRSVEAGGRRGETEELHGLIQTDAAINPGNSGGPLLDISGRVIGMNVAMADLAQSIGFAIPGNAVRNAFTEAKLTGQIKEIEKALLGVRYIPITPEMQSQNQLPFNYGMLVTTTPGSLDPAIIPNSPAALVGIAANDIILEAEGKQLNERYLLSDFITEQNPGDAIELKIYREGVTRVVKVKLGKK